MCDLSFRAAKVALIKMGIVTGLFHRGSYVTHGHITSESKGQDAGPGLSSQFLSGFNTACMLRSMESPLSL